MNPIPVSKLIEALEMECDEYIFRIDRETGEVVSAPSDLLHAVDEGDEDRLEGLTDWEQEEIATARMIAEASHGRFVEPPTKFEFHEYRQMERFIQTIKGEGAAEQLWRAIKGKGAFRCFKDTAARLDLLDQWYRYRDAALKAFVIDWAAANEIEIVDDVDSPGV